MILLLLEKEKREGSERKGKERKKKKMKTEEEEEKGEETTMIVREGKEEQKQEEEGEEEEEEETMEGNWNEEGKEWSEYSQVEINAMDQKSLLIAMEEIRFQMDSLEEELGESAYDQGNDGNLLIEMEYGSDSQS